MSDDIRRLSDELARDPSSFVFLQLGEVLRQREQLDHAFKIAIRGLERHPHNAEAHDLLARICVDRGELERAFDEWDMVLRLDPEHVNARKGMGFVCFRQGRLSDAQRYLTEANDRDPDDASIIAALENIRKRLNGRNGATNETGLTNGRSDQARSVSVPSSSYRASEAPEHAAWSTQDAASSERPDHAARSTHHAAPAERPAAQPRIPATGPSSRDPRYVFADLIGEDERTALLLDAQGLVLAGAYVSHEGRDVAQEVGAELSGVSEEARRAMRHLGLGEWTSIVFETEVATVAMSPAPDEGLLLVAAAKSTPLGLVTRFLHQAAERARTWLDGLR